MNFNKSRKILTFGCPIDHIAVDDRSYRQHW